jgi:hypothetical protein
MYRPERSDSMCAVHGIVWFKTALAIPLCGYISFLRQLAWFGAMLQPHWPAILYAIRLSVEVVEMPRHSHSAITKWRFVL